jgi:hypothetical protein
MNQTESVKIRSVFLIPPETTKNYQQLYMKNLKLLLICMLFPLVASASVWDTQYKQIEQSIKQPEFANREFLITKYGASPKASAAANQKAINKAIDACTKAGGGRVVVPAGTFNTGAIHIKSGVNLVVTKGDRKSVV